MPTNDNEIPTPRTDEAVFTINAMPVYVVVADFARTLELENIQLREELEQRRAIMAAMVRAFGKGCTGLSHDELLSKVETAIKDSQFYKTEYEAFNVVLTGGLELLQKFTGYTNDGLDQGINRIANERDNLRQDLSAFKQCCEELLEFAKRLKHKNWMQSVFDNDLDEAITRADALMKGEK